MPNLMSTTSLTDYRVSLTPKSRNAKTGPIPVSTTTNATCPTACPFNRTNEGGCYADGGPLRIQWDKVTRGEAGMAWGDFLQAVRALPADQLWRHNQAGDLPGIGDSIDGKALYELVAANTGKRGFTYTHKPMADIQSREAIHHANQSGFTINLSANNLDHADELADLGIAPVVVVLPKQQKDNCTTPKGRKVIVCPATQRDDVSCMTCGLCARLRDAIVGFPAHGAASNKANRIAVTRSSSNVNNQQAAQAAPKKEAA
jgi:hypothetical protein